MLRFVLGFAAGWIAKKWLDEEIDKNKVSCGDYDYTDALIDKYEDIKRKFSGSDSESSIKRDKE